MTNAAEVRLWHTMSFRDADAMIAFLSAIGFVEHATYRSETDPSVVEHAEWLWPGGGGLMFGSLREGGAVTNVGGSAAYLVADDPDAVFDRAVEAGATVLRAMVDQDYGGRGGSVEDPEGNHWSFGSYQPR
ncbi:VOC family protein [Nocardioides caricicola]|uniref:VOC family protein n=1 Tax=Nocardioides caricicola TaxID=634770 RepID=A0ABW0MX08_9ACTN